MAQLYESIVILRPSLADEDIQKTLDKVKSTLEKSGGTIERLENWGKKKLAYEVKREKKGVYVQLNFHGSGVAVTELERFFRLEDAIMKFLTVKLEAPKPVSAGTEPPTGGPVALEHENGRV
jgi:small subunit ribosomal protein S6